MAREHFIDGNLDEGTGVEGRRQKSKGAPPPEEEHKKEAVSSPEDEGEDTPISGKKKTFREISFSKDDEDDQSYGSGL